jgi:hypothetical protein
MLLDTSGAEFDTDTVQGDTSHVTVTFPSPTAGTAILT